MAHAGGGKEVKIELRPSDVEDAVKALVALAFPGVIVTHVKFTREKSGPGVRAEVLVEPVTEPAPQPKAAVFDHNV